MTHRIRGTRSWGSLSSWNWPKVALNQFWQPVNCQGQVWKPKIHSGSYWVRISRWPGRSENHPIAIGIHLKACSGPVSWELRRWVLTKAESHWAGCQTYRWKTH